MIGVDTFSWQKLIRLYDTQWKDLVSSIIKEFDLFITVEGRKEFERRFPAHLFLLDGLTIVPILNEVFDTYIRRGFDATDASLLEYADIKKARIITEDKLMLLEGTTKRRNVVQLIDFFYELFKSGGSLTKHEFRQLLRTFRDWRNITKRKERLYSEGSFESYTINTYNT